MSVRIFYPQKDSTIYFYSGSFSNSLINTGNDAILEVNKPINSNYTRALLQFNTTDISTYLDDNSLHLNNTQSLANLRVFTAEAEEIPADISLDIYPVSQSWDNGIGKANFSPIETGSVNWYYKTDGVLWNTLSSGGGTYVTSSTSYASFSLDESTDIESNITDILVEWISGSVDNNGLIIKRNSTDEATSYGRGNLKYFSKNTNTIFRPRIEVYGNDKEYSFTTASDFQHYTGSKQTIIKSSNLKGVYYYDNTTRINFFLRETHPTVGYVTSFDDVDEYQSLYKMFTSSSYRIKDLASNETIIDFNYNYTAVNNDEDGSYINLNMNNFEVDRYYSIAFKYLDQDNNTTFYSDDRNLTFKVVKTY